MRIDAGLIRAVGLFVPIALIAVAVSICKPEARLRAAALLATLWNLPALTLVHCLAMRAGWWSFDAQGGLFLGMPVDLWLGWAGLWGAVPALMQERVPMMPVTAALIALDLIYMPLMRPVLLLSPRWLAGEMAAVAICLIPAQLLARWTSRDKRLNERVLLQAICFGGLVMGVIPAAILEQTGATWSVRNPVLWFNLMSIPAVVGLSAVQEFATRGRGTPVPFDPPKSLVSTGVYAYVRNPMQMAQICILLLLGAALGSYWIALAAAGAFLYSAGLARGDEQDDLSVRFGSAWAEYARHVHNWLPRWRPYRPAPARLYVASSCDMCNELGRWIVRRHPINLELVAAELHPKRDLERITYDAMDGGPEESGVPAVARALEHIHLGWAFFGWAIRLPVIGYGVQVVADASGGGKRTVARRELQL